MEEHNGNYCNLCWIGDDKLPSRPCNQCQPKQLDPMPVVPDQSNQIDLSKVDFCECCKNKIIAEFTKAFRENNL